MLNELITSRVTYKLVKHFSENDGWLHVRGIELAINENVGNVSRTMKKLERCNLVESRIKGNKIEYKAIRSKQRRALNFLMNNHDLLA